MKNVEFSWIKKCTTIIKQRAIIIVVIIISVIICQFVVMVKGSSPSWTKAC